MTIAAIITQARAARLVEAWTNSEGKAIPSHWPQEPGDNRSLARFDAADRCNAALSGTDAAALAIQAFWAEGPGGTHPRAIVNAFYAAQEAAQEAA